MKKYNIPKALFTFIDLFAGIGGIRIALEKCHGKCIFTSEIDRYCQKTYQSNFNDKHSIKGDITQIHEDEIPNHDLLLAGFPCQPFSIAGVSKKKSLGYPHGFKCNTQGTLFFDIARILARKRPKAFLLENVKNLLTHNNRNTFNIIMHTLKEELGYEIHYKVINAKFFVPQNRERIIIIGFSTSTNFSWDSLQIPQKMPKLESILHPEDGSEPPDNRFTYGPIGTVSEKYILTDKLWNYLKNYALKHRLKGNGFGYGLFGKQDIARTLSARYYKDGSEILINRGEKNPRRLTPKECARLMGFPENFMLEGVSDTQLYKQFGNSVAVPVIYEVAKIMIPYILN